MTKNDFDAIAPYYDFLQWVVFGRQLLAATTHFFDCIAPGSRVLVVGGGTGQLLDYLPHGCQVDYLEKSQKMIDLARKNRPQPTYILGDILKFRRKRQYDVVICPFVLDVFCPVNIKEVLLVIRGLIRPEGLLLVSDFALTNKWWHEATLWVMYNFFAKMSGLEADKLLDIMSLLKDAGFSQQHLQVAKRGFVFSTMCRLN